MRRGRGAGAPYPVGFLSEAVCDLLDPTNGVPRTLHLHAAAWDFFDTGLAFNRKPNAHTADAINVRRNFATPIDCARPEWEKDKGHVGVPTRDEPARWIAGTTPKIKAGFQIEPAVSTSDAVDSKKYKADQWVGTLFETQSPACDEMKTRTHGKIFVLDRDVSGNGSAYLKLSCLCPGRVLGKPWTKNRRCDAAPFCALLPSASRFRRRRGNCPSRPRPPAVAGHGDRDERRLMSPCFPRTSKFSESA